MANYNKSFNFRNGLQVDDDKFIVDSLGRVGIGTTNPTEILDVYGDVKITGFVTTTNLAVSGVSTFYNDVKIGSGITLSSSGNINVNTIYTSSIGIGTTNPTSKFYVVGDAYVTGVTTSQQGFTSGIGITNPVKITVSGTILTFTVAGIGSTSLTLF